MSARQKASQKEEAGEKDESPPAKPSPPHTTHPALKALIVCLLVSQSCSYVLFRQYIQTSISRVNSNFVLLLGEIMKLIFALGMVVVHDEETRKKKLEDIVKGGIVMIFPAASYLAMNLLSFVALQYISGSLFITIAQLKTLTTALCSVFFLSNSLPPVKWISLFILVFGSILVTYKEEAASSSSSTVPPVEPTSSLPFLSSFFSFWHEISPSFLLGLMAVISEVTISGFMSVYFERILKFHKGSIWERNIQLAVLSSVLYYINLLFSVHSVSEEFQKISAPVIITSILGAAGGILVALCLKYLDSVTKCVILSFSVLLTILLGHVIFGSVLETTTLVGAGLVILACLAYNQPERAEKLMYLFVVRDDDLKR